MRTFPSLEHSLVFHVFLPHNFFLSGSTSSGLPGINLFAVPSDWDLGSQGAVLICTTCAPLPLPGGLSWAFEALSLILSQRLMQTCWTMWELTAPVLGSFSICYHSLFSLSLSLPNFYFFFLKLQTYGKPGGIFSMFPSPLKHWLLA